MQTLAESLHAKPGKVIACLCLAQVVIWTLSVGLFTTAPPLDVGEMLAWGQEWQIGHHKHPPGPAWMAEISSQLGGGVILGPTIVSELCIVLTYLFVYLLGRRLMEPHLAALGTLLLTGTFYFTWSTPELNHNVPQMPQWAAAIYVFSFIWQKPKALVPWLFLGLTA